MTGDITVAVSQIVRQINQEALARSASGLNILRNSAMRILSQNGSGRRYGRHVASAPGQPPAPDKGNLRRNWSQQRLASSLGNGLRIRLRLRSRMFYAIFLDKGTRKMAPRPFRERIRRHARPKIAALFANL